MKHFSKLALALEREFVFGFLLQANHATTDPDRLAECLDEVGVLGLAGGSILRRCCCLSVSIANDEQILVIGNRISMSCNRPNSAFYSDGV